MHEFSPRGIIKWAPFSALGAYEEEIGQIYHSLDETPYIVVSEDKLEDINYTLNIAIEKNLYIEVIYYENKQLHSISSNEYYIDNEFLKIDNKKIQKNAIRQVLIK